MSLRSLNRVLLELVGCPPHEIPVYRNDVVIAAEQTIRSAKQDIRALINFHQDAVENLKRQLHAVAAGETVVIDDSTGAQTPKELMALYKVVTSKLDVALGIELSRFQQIRRGLNIYHATRINRLKRIWIAKLCGQRALYPGGPAIGPESIPQDLLEKCSPAEVEFLQFLTRSVQENGFTSSVDQCVNASDEPAVGRLRPPVWLATFASNPETIPEVEMRDWGSVPPQWRFGDITVGRAEDHRNTAA